MSRLLNKTALVAGGTSEAGLATARRFVAEGARVAITGADAGRLKAAQRELGDDVLPLRVDAADVAGQRDIARTLGAAFGALDAVFVNACLGEFHAIEEWDEAGFDRLIGVGLKGPFFLIQALLPVLANPASIVLNASIDPRVGAIRSSVQAAARAGLVALARTLSGEFAGRGIRVNAVRPGPIATTLYRRIGIGADRMAALVEQVPAGRPGEPDEVAEAAVFLASDAGAFVVGAELVTAGGGDDL